MTRIAFGQSLLDHGWCWCWWELSGDLTGTNPQPICSRRRPAAAQSHPPASSSLWWARAGSGLAPPQPCQQPPSAQLSPAPHTTNLILIARHVATVGSCSEWRSQFQHGGKEKRLYSRVNIIGTYSHMREGPARDFTFIFEVCDTCALHTLAYTRPGQPAPTLSWAQLLADCWFLLQINASVLATVGEQGVRLLNFLSRTWSTIAYMSGNRRISVSDTPVPSTGPSHSGWLVASLSCSLRLALQLLAQEWQGGPSVGVVTLNVNHYCGNDYQCWYSRFSRYYRYSHLDIRD